MQKQVIVTMGGLARMALVALLWPAMAATGQGTPQFLVSDLSGDKIVRFDYPSGEPVDHFVGAGISPLESSLFMVYGPDGHLYVSSFVGHAVLRYDGQSGRFLDECDDRARRIDRPAWAGVRPRRRFVRFLGREQPCAEVRRRVGFVPWYVCSR